MTTELTRIQVRRDVAATWATMNPVMSSGEPGLEADTGRLKIGDGSTVWTLLPYQSFRVLASGTVTLTAGSSGLVANTAITANAIVKAWNVSSAGAVGALGVTPSAGAGFTIRSSSGTDTSKVYYEIVSY